MKKAFSRKVFRTRRLKIDELKKKKIANMGTAEMLAGGIAHEFNNILGALDGHAEWALENGDLNSMKEALEIVRKGCARSSDITRSLQTLGQPKEEKWGTVNLVKILEEAFQIVSKMGQVEFHFDFPKSFRNFKLEANSTQFIEVFVNLFKNSIEAGARNIYLRLDSSKTPLKSSKNKKVVLFVEDDGPGIEPALVNSVFEPFFTTKGVLSNQQGVASTMSNPDLHSGGSGLGLFIVKNIIADHGGKLALETKKSKWGGAKFRIEFQK